MMIAKSAIMRPGTRAGLLTVSLTLSSSQLGNAQTNSRVLQDRPRARWPHAQYPSAMKECPFQGRARRIPTVDRSPQSRHMQPRHITASLVTSGPDPNRYGNGDKQNHWNRNPSRFATNSTERQDHPFSRGLAAATPIAKICAKLTKVGSSGRAIRARPHDADFSVMHCRSHQIYF
jgi:hypothetical protein